MNLTNLPAEALALLNQGNIINLETAISDEVATILLKLWNREPLTRGEMGEEVTPAEVAAIWSVKYRTPIKTDYVRQVKRGGRIEPSKAWGKGTTYRCLYKIRTIINVEVRHQRGRRPVQKQEPAVVISESAPGAS